jgi:hypothetical protein
MFKCLSKKTTAGMMQRLRIEVDRSVAQAKSEEDSMYQDKSLLGIDRREFCSGDVREQNLVDILDSKAPIYPVRKGKAGPAERFWA